MCIQNETKIDYFVTNFKTIDPSHTVNVVVILIDNHYSFFY